MQVFAIVDAIVEVDGGGELTREATARAGFVGRGQWRGLGGPCMMFAECLETTTRLGIDDSQPGLAGPVMFISVKLSALLS